MKSLILFFTLFAVFISCKKEYDTPPLSYPGIEGSVTIDSLRQWQQSEGSISFDSELSVYGIVTMDETDGNIYKNVYMQDHTGAINVRMLSGGGLYEGDSIRIALKGCYLNSYNGVLQLDSVDVDYNIVKQSVDNSIMPELTTIDQITSAKESELIQLENVQFVSWQLDETYADKENLISEDRLLEDQSGNTVVVRTSGYSSFADQQIAQGSGSIVCIVNHFNGEIQLLIRSFAEINLNNPRFNGLVLLKDFNDDEITSGGWTTQNVVGTVAQWETSSAGGAPNPYAAISNYENNTKYDTDSWLISPSVDLSGLTTPTLSFDNAYKYTGLPLELYVSTNYVSGDPSSGTWANITGSANWSGGNFIFVNSGDIDLSPYLGTNVHVAFRYQGTTSDGSTWELDNILIKS
ncbi:MAG: DUF5689 domain-containing protein [Crocinitomicaceae bacterium]